MRLLLALLALIVFNFPLFAGGNADLRKGNKAYDEEKYGEAFEYYNKTAEAGQAERGAYNSAAALYRLKDYDAALEAYDSLKGSEDFKQDSYYNSANAYFEQGNKEEAAKSLRQALLLNREDKEALHNLQFILKQQQNEKDQQNKNNNQGDNKNQQDNQDNSDEQNKNGNSQNEEQNQQKEDKNSSGQELSQSEAENILKMSKEHVNEHKGNISAAGAASIEKDW